VLGAPVVMSAFGCTIERQPTEGDGVAVGPPRPILLPWSDDAVLVAAPPRERPVAYMSRRTMEIWIDLDYRDRLQFALGAHISVSTGHWRVPLHGDPENIPIQAGDPLREFEEIDMRMWDAAIEPMEGDVRVMRGAPVAAEVSIRCQPLSGGGTWFDAEPVSLFRSGPADGQLTREELMDVGTAGRFVDRDCTQAEGRVRLLTWASREPILEGA
jgi:hypothetical protein